MSTTINDIDKDKLLYAIEKVRALSDYNDVVPVTGIETLKNIDTLYGYKVLHIDGIYNDNETINDKLFIIPYDSELCKFKISDSEYDGYEVIFNED